MSGDLPGAVLFSCSHNAIRSPMAEAIMKHYYGHRVFVDSCGVRPGERDEFIVEVRKAFQRVKVLKPKASRAGSREVYLVARNYRL